MGVVTIEDYNGSIEAILFFEAWAKYETGLTVGRILGFQGSFRESRDSLSFNVSSVYGDVSQMKGVKINNLYIEVVQDEICQDFVRKTKRVLVSHPGQISVWFAIYRTREQLEGDDSVRRKPRIISTSKRFCVDAEENLLTELKALDGIADVYLE